MSTAIFIKRIYEPPADEDGYRVLVDRLWPRGVSRASGRIDQWMKAAAPSNALRRRIHAEPDPDRRWAEFVQAYAVELEGGETREAALELLEIARAGPLTLLYAARDEVRNNASALRDWLLARLD